MNDSDQSYKKSVIPLFLEVRPSRIFQAFSLMLHGAAIYSVTQTRLELQWVALATAVILVSAYYAHSLGSRTYRLQWRQDKRWEIRFASGDKRTGKMLKGTFFNPWFVVLALRTGNTRKDIIIIPKDSISADDFIRLRTRLKIEAKAAIAD